MSKFKKLLSWVLVVAMTAGISIAGTMAYYTDKDSAVNVMVTGNVQITQNEQERAETGGLQDFTQGQHIAPAADVTGAKEDITVNGYDLKIRTGETYVDKIVSVTNDGASDAYVRTIFAFPEAGEFDTTTDASEQWFHWNGVSDTDTNPNNGWIWGSDKTTEWPGNNSGWDVVENVEINGKKYDIYVATNKNAIAPGASTSPTLMGFFLDTRVDYDGTDYIFTDKTGKEWNLGDISNLDILVLTQAAQTEGFADAWTALDTAFGDVTAENAVKWFGDLEIPVAVATADELEKAIANGGNIVLGSDIEVTGMVEIPVNGSVSIDGQGYTLTRADSYTGTILSLGEYAELALSNITLDGENVESSGNLIYIDSYGKLTLNDGTVLENHVGGTTYDSARGPENSVIHCDGETTIVMNDGSVIQNNVAKGNFATVIASMHGLTCELNGGKIINNTSEKNHYTVYFGNSANITVSDGFEMSDNIDGGLMHVRQQSSFTMNGGTLDGNGKKAIETLVAKYVSLNGGKIVGNVILNWTAATVGGADIDGYIWKDNEVTKWALNLTPDFGTVRYSIQGNITQLNIIPAEGYTYVDGDESKLICENTGYETYWDAESGCFKVKASE